MKLYKYRAINEYVLNSIKNKSIWLSNPKYLNDPFDTARFLIENSDMYISGNEFLSIEEIKENIEAINKSLNECGICSFSREFTIEKLWSHYCNVHK